MTHDEIKEIAEVAARAAVSEIFLRMGLAISHDTDIIQIQQDMTWLRNQRTATEELAKWVKRGLVTTVLSGMLYLLWEAFKIALLK